MRFIATFNVLCASGDKAPKDIPGVTKRLRMDVMLSTSSKGIAVPNGLKSSRSRKWIGGLLCILAEYCFHISKDALLQAVCIMCIEVASHAWVSPDLRDL